MLPFQFIAGGSFTSDATVDAQEVQISDRPDMIVIKNRTNWGDSSEVASIRSYWFQGMDQGVAQAENQAATNALSTANITSNGIRVYNTSTPPVFASLAATAISAADPAVVDMVETGEIQVGDVVRITNSTGMLQIGGYSFSVTAVTNDVSVSLNFDASGEAAAATAADVELIIPNRFFPRWRYIVPVGGFDGISQASQAVISTSVYHDFKVGEIVSFRVPTQFGMDEINNLHGTIVSIGNVAASAYDTAIAANYNAFRIDIDTSGFTAFALPASAVTSTNPFSPAVVLPSGAGPIVGANPPISPVDAAFDNRNRWLIKFGSNVITVNSAVYDWQAYRYDNFSAL